MTLTLIRRFLAGQGQTGAIAFVCRCIFRSNVSAYYSSMPWWACRSGQVINGLYGGILTGFYASAEPRSLALRGYCLQHPVSFSGHFGYSPGEKLSAGYEPIDFGCIHIVLLAHFSDSRRFNCGFGTCYAISICFAPGHLTQCSWCQPESFK